MSPGKIREWSRQHPAVLDAAVAGLVVLVGVPIGWVLGWTELALSVALGAPLFWRRRHPVASFAVISLISAVQLAMLDVALPADVAFLIVLYALASRADRDSIRVAGLVVGLVGAMLAAVRWEQPLLPNLLIGWLLVAAVWLLGTLMRTHQRAMPAAGTRVLRPREFYEWSRQRPWVLDAGIVAVLGLLSAPAGLRSFGVLEVVLSAGLALPLLWRRRRPVVSFAVVSFACASQVVLIDYPLLSDVAFLLGLYALSAYASRQWVRLAGLGVGLFGAALATYRWYAVPPLPNMLMLCMFVFAAWLLGDLMRTRRAHIAALEERAERLERERDQQARIARSAERARIAREMHDVVAHSLAIVIAQADGGRYAADTDPEAAKHALDTIGRTGRRASAEMRRLLGVLRTEASTEPSEGPAAGHSPEGSVESSTGPTAGAINESMAGHPPDSAAPEYAPQPGVDRIPQLVQEMRSGGLSCELESGDGAAEQDDVLPEGLSLAAYRVVQEALTNTLKHGGPGVHATVTVRRDDDRLLIAVQDDGRGAAASGDGAGHGLSGMAERVQLFGGRLRTGPRTGGGFRVRAEFPIRDQAAVVSG